MALIAAAVYGVTLFGIGMWFIRKHRLEAERREIRKKEAVPCGYKTDTADQHKNREVAMHGANM